MSPEAIPLYFTGICRTDASEVSCNGKVMVMERGIEVSTPVCRRSTAAGLKARVFVVLVRTLRRASPRGVPSSGQVQSEIFRPCITDSARERRMTCPCNRTISRWRNFDEGLRAEGDEPWSRRPDLRPSIRLDLSSPFRINHFASVSRP